MKRNDLIFLLEEYRTEYPEEIEYRTKILRFVQEQPECFSRQTRFGHITASAWVLDASRRKALLLRHAKLGILCQPGGHCDDSEDVRKEALREAREETGVQAIQLLQEGIFDLDIHDIPPRKGEPGHKHFDIRFLAGFEKDEEPKIGEESTGFLWIQACRPVNDLDPSLLRMQQKWHRLLETMAL